MWRLLALAFLFPALVAAQEEHNHPAPEKLGTVSFPTSCKPTTQQEFNRAIALLHSFATNLLRKRSKVWPNEILGVLLPTGASR